MKKKVVWKTLVKAFGLVLEIVTVNDIYEL